ncbi:Delta2-dienoyl-CoA-isomerase [Guyanagaster necrorhizus]|uniref:Delta2-dienoyl-CoA-isomerase n=1 Tax=Guyanagaster necrorhizus TaxID=856835 RepID=A0A9P7VIN7_9AGAR|nr:Delta2-dienoyl-CoA-isomerase [Guyanagaster necrorhizus MCA 3950]KAG7441399.1 Delta2-dienoyl-CoA-isomerase [Guyanagaster necrorhizus MCA 3950]
MASQFSTKFIRVSEPSPHVFHVELSRKSVNAFNVDFWTQYGEVFEKLAEEDVRAVVLSSALPKIFTAGIDLSDLASLVSSQDEDSARLAIKHLKHIKTFQYAIGAPARCPFPVIAAIHGAVLGLGVDIVCACDIRYAASNATFCVKEADVGLAADIGTLGYLPKITGNISLVREFSYTSQTFSASVAEKMGLLSSVIEGGRDDVVGAALELAKVIASKSPVAVAGTKHIISHALDNSIAANLDYTAVWNGGALQTRDIIENVSAMKARRSPTFAPLRTKATSKL